MVTCFYPGPNRTMAGRRLRTAVRNVLVTNGYPADTRVVIAGLSNTYSGYITTYEEYQVSLEDSPQIIRHFAIRQPTSQ